MPPVIAFQDVSWSSFDDVLDLANTLGVSVDDAAASGLSFDMSGDGLVRLVTDSLPVLGQGVTALTGQNLGAIAGRSSILESVISDLVDQVLPELGAIAFLPAPLLKQFAVQAVGNLVDEILPNLGAIATLPLPTLVTLATGVLNNALTEVAAQVPTFESLFNYSNLAISPENAGRAYDQIVVFGDSLSDTGNLFKALNGAFPPPPYFQGRLSNGPLWIDDLAPTLGLTADQVLNFAVAGATTGHVNIGATTAGITLPIQLPGLLDEVDAFTATLGCAGANPNALYVVWAGANDFLTLPKTVDEAIAAVLQGVENVVTAVTDLAQAGARIIAVPNVPNIGRTPLVNQQGEVVTATAFSVGFDLVLDYALSQLEKSLGIDIVQIDTLSAGEAIAQNPSQFGFTNITDALLTQLLSPTPPSDPQGFFYWDNFHPTAAAQQQIANVFARSLATPTASNVLNTSLGLAATGINGSGFQSVLSNLLNEVKTALPSYLPLLQSVGQSGGLTTQSLGLP